MNELIKKYRKFSRMIIGWQITTIVTIFVPFISAFTGNETLFYIVIAQIILVLVSIISLTVSTVKRTSVVRELAIKMSVETDDVYQKLIDSGISERCARAYRVNHMPTDSAEDTAVIKAPERICCPNCGSENVVKTQSDFEEAFWLVVLLTAVGSLTPIAVICFGICAVTAILTAMINKLSGVTVRKNFRSNGRKLFEWLLNSLPKKVDKLICEGTTLSRYGYVPQTETALEERAAKLFSETRGPVFVLQSSMNIDRIVTMYRAARKTGRVFLEEAYMAGIASAAGEHIPNPNFRDVYAFITNPSRYKFIEKYKRKIGKSAIAQKRFVMCVRTSMPDYLKSLSEMMSFENGLLVYSFWSGYRETESMKPFLTECEKMGLRIEILHTSGHADEGTIRKLIERVNPSVLIPVHTENAERFKEIVSEIIIEI